MNLLVICAAIGLTGHAAVTAYIIGTITSDGTIYQRAAWWTAVILYWLSMFGLVHTLTVGLGENVL